MKRKAILIGYTGEESELKGVISDIKNYENFLMSNKGGKWNRSEIITLLDSDKATIVQAIDKIKTEKNDVVFSAFSGHGAYSVKTEQRVLWVDKTKEGVIRESRLHDLAPRQIMIIDCCAGLVEYSTATMIMDSHHIIANSKQTVKDYRKIYEEKCMECPEQFIRMYSCSIKESADETPKGGIYTHALLDISKQNVSPKLSALSAHNQAAEIVIKKSAGKQNPEYQSTRATPMLPISIN